MAAGWARGPYAPAGSPRGRQAAAPRSAGATRGNDERTWAVEQLMLTGANTGHEIWTAVALAVVITQAATVATSVYLHRALAHRSIHARRAADVAFRTVLWLTTGQRRREWVAGPRKHHPYT